MIIPCFQCGSDKITIMPADCSGRFTIHCECGDTPHRPGSKEPMCFQTPDSAIESWNLRVYGKMTRKMGNMEHRIHKLERFIITVPHSKACTQSMAYGGECSCGKNLVLR